MTNEKLYEVLGDINEKYVSEARVYQKAKKPIWAKWGAIAACLVLVCVVAIPLFSHNNSVTTPGIADAAPMIYVNDTLYKQSTSQTSFNELKDDFVYLGVIESDVTNFQGTNDAGNYLDGIPKENFQANHPIVGSEVYQKELAEKIKKLRSEIEKQSSRSMTTDMFIGLVRKYTRARKLTPRMLNELIEKIEVFNAEKIDSVWEQRLRIHYNCVGTIEIPTVLPLPIPEVSVNTRKGVVVNYAPCELAV